VSLDYQRVVEILNSLQPIEVFSEAVRRIEEGRADQGG
jgi:hypothetical protein